MARAAKTAQRKQAKLAKKAAKVGGPQHPSYHDMIKSALMTAHGNAKGLSRQAIKRVISEQFPMVQNVPVFNARLREALRHGIDSGDFVHPRRHQGSFRLASVRQSVHIAIHFLYNFFYII